MKKVKITLGTLAALVLGAEAVHASEAGILNNRALRRGVYYSLTPAAAQALNINLEKLVELAQLKQAEVIAFQVKEDGELDLSIYKQGIFKQLRADIVKASLN